MDICKECTAVYVHLRVHCRVHAFVSVFLHVNMCNMIEDKLSSWPSTLTSSPGTFEWVFEII